MRHEHKLSQLRHTRKNQHAGIIKAWFIFVCLLFSGAASAETVQLAWDPVQDSQVAVYQVHYGTASGQYNDFVESATNSASIQGLQPGSTYFFAVRACDSSKTNCSGFSNEVTKTIPDSALVATFATNKTTGEAPLTVLFTDTSSGTITARTWQFGDGGSATGTNVATHTYTTPGTYDVQLSVSGPGGSDVEVKTNHIVVQAPQDSGESGDSGSDSGNPGDTLNEGFGAYTSGDQPAGWLDTAANNSMNQDDSLFKVMDLSGERVIGTSSTATNIHSHYTAPAVKTLTAYEYSGRMRFTEAASSSSIGVTFFSDYPQQDAYYRLRSYKGNGFHLAPHGTSVLGDVETGIAPTKNTWYQYHIQVEDTGAVTNIRAKVWAQGQAEPTNWQVEAYDNSASRLKSGAVGLWSMGPGYKYWDDIRVTNIASTGDTGGGTSPSNTPPDAQNDSATVFEDSANNTLDVLANDTDADGHTLTITGASASKGTVSINSGTLRYTPAANFNGTATLTYTVSDGAAGTDSATVTVNVTPVNDAPNAVNDAATVSEDSSNNVLNVLSNDTDIDGHALTITSANASKGTVSINSGTLRYSPPNNFNGTTTLTYTVSDGAGGTDSATVTVNVTAINDAPQAANDTATVLEDSVNNTLSVLSNDSDIDGQALTITSANASKGTVSINSGTLRYTPSSNFNGTAILSYTVSDSAGGTDSATVTVNVTPVNDAPNAVNDAATVSEDSSNNVLNVLSNDTDIDGQALTITSANASKGTVSINSGKLRYSPPSNFNGTATLSYTVSDGAGGTDSATVTVTVTAVDDPPVASFTTNGTSGTAPFTVMFADTSTGTISARNWQFGDGDSSANASMITHTYNVPGTYIPQLTITGPGGSDTFVASSPIVVQASDEETDDDSPPGLPLFETGEITIDHNWKLVNFRQTFIDPVVIVKSLGANDADPSVIRIDAVDSDGFMVRIQEWDYLDDVHAPENASYLVVERGIYQLADGSWLEADHVYLDADNESFTDITLNAEFTEIPVVMASIETFNEADAVTPRLRNVDRFGFQITLQEQEAYPQQHMSETIGFIAWEPSSGTIDGLRFEVGTTDDEVTHNAHTIVYGTDFAAPPIFLADMQTTNGSDTANLRWQNKNLVSVEAWVQEEQSLDSEIAHTTEIVGYVFFENDSDGEGGTEPPPKAVIDMELTDLVVPLRMKSQSPQQRVKTLTVTACNLDAVDAASGTISLEGLSVISGIEPVFYSESFMDLAAGACHDATFTWQAPSGGTHIHWTAEVTGQADPNSSNNTMTYGTLVYPVRNLN